MPGQECNLICGNGMEDEPEECDDGGEIPGDGCSNLCTIETDWVCPVVGLPCTKCGNGRVDPGENCEDSNSEDGDGCNAQCTVENGYLSNSPSLGVTAICGDGLIVGAEECDPP